MAPRTYRRITLVALLALAFIVVTGGAVRLTGSGLGCPDWPNCDTHLVRVARGDDGSPITGPPVDPGLAPMGRLLVIAAAVVVFLGTVVTASGPHPGSNGDQVVERLPFALHQVAQLHGIAVMLFLAMTVATIW